MSYKPSYEHLIKRNIGLFVDWKQCFCNSTVNLGDFDDVLKLYGNDVNQDRLAIQLHVLYSTLPSDVENEERWGKTKEHTVIKVIKFL